MATLFEIGAELEALEQLLDDVGGEVTDPQVNAVITEWFETIAADEGRKLDHYCGLIKRLEMEAMTAKAEAEEYRKRAEVRENRVKWLKLRMIQHLAATNRTKVQSASGRVVAVQSNGGQVPVRINYDLLPDTDTLPPQFVEIKKTLNAVAIREALERGESLPFARLEDRGTHLRIR
jgi:hypothetical protein